MASLILNLALAYVAKWRKQKSQIGLQYKQKKLKLTNVSAH